MSDTRVTRMMGPIGVAALISFVVGFGVLNGNQPNENASGTTDVAWMNSHSTMRWAQIYVIAFGLTLTSGVAILSGSTLPRWLGTVSVIIGILCVLGPIGLIGTLAAALWLPVTGFVISAQAKNATPMSLGAETPIGIA